MNDSFYGYDEHIKIGLTIKKLRIQAGMSQTKLAVGICDRTTIIHLEKGRSKQPSIYLLNQLCRRLSITLDDFFLLAYGGEINQFWLKKNEIDALMKIREYEKAFNLAKRYYNDSLHPVDKQYYGLVEANYYYSLNEYKIAKEKYLEALSITCSNIQDEVFTLTEMRLINGIIYCNWRIDEKLRASKDTINYIKVLNTSIYNFPMDKDYRLIISLMISTIHFYFTLKQYNDTITIINNAIYLSQKYCCYDYLGNLWLMLANIYEILNDNEKSKEYYDKSNTFFKLFNEAETLAESIKHQNEIYENINC
jgi:DNA-binding XRE family transcriptional regulator